MDWGCPLVTVNRTKGDETQIDKSLAPLHLFLRTFEPVRQSNGTVARSNLYTIYTPQESCRSGNLFEKGKTIVRTFIHQPFTSTTTLVSTSAIWWLVGSHRRVLPSGKSFCQKSASNFSLKLKFGPYNIMGDARNCTRKGCIKLLEISRFCIARKKGMNSSSMILVLRKCGCAFGVLSILFLRRDHSPCSEKPRSLTGASRRQEAHDAALAPSAVRLSGCAKTGRWDPVGPRRSETGRDGSRRAPWFFKWLMPGQFTRGSSPLPRLQFLR